MKMISNANISVAVVDETRAGIRAYVEKIDGVQIVGEATNVDDALLLIDRAKPDLILAAIFTGAGGIDLVEEVLQRYPRVGILILSKFADQEHLVKAWLTGASSYIQKDSISEFEMAVRVVAVGHGYITPHMTKVLTEYLRRAEVTAAPLVQLTIRQHQVLRLIVAGETNKEIAGSLSITVKTVEKHRTEIMRRLGVHNAAALVRRAVQERILAVSFRSLEGSVYYMLLGY